MATANNTKTKNTAPDEETVAPAKENTAPAVKEYIVAVDNNPNFCGIGAGGAQFANGQARVTSARLAAWFREHDGYTVTEA